LLALPPHAGLWFVCKIKLTTKEPKDTPLSTTTDRWMLRIQLFFPHMLLQISFFSFLQPVYRPPLISVNGLEASWGVKIALFEEKNSAD
jgi:hypothetical protein